MMLKLIKNDEKNNKLVFSADDIDAAFANAIRRAAIEEVPVLGSIVKSEDEITRENKEKGKKDEYVLDIF